MANVKRKNILQGFIASSFIVGIVYIIIVYVLEFFIKDLPINFGSLIELHKNSFILFFIDIIPALLSYVTYRIGKIIVSKLNFAEDSIEKELIKSKKIYEFIEELRKGNNEIKFDTTYKEDKLVSSLNNLRDEQKRSREDEVARKKEDEQRHWVSEGLAKFGAILRDNQDNLKELTEEIIKNITKYLDAKQAGFFVVKEESSEKYFEMTAFFAYNRKKFADKKIKWGEGLIGACALEKKTIFLKDTSQNFVEITSGLGKANPRSIIIVPVKDEEDNVYGIIELASFKVFEKYERDFVEQVADSIASTIANIKINMQTAILLKESQKQAELMAEQEEIMRQNMKELTETQKEAAMQSDEFVSFTNSVNHTLIRAEYSLDGKLLYANTKFINKLGYKSASEIEKRHISLFISDKDKDWFDDLWQKLVNGGQHYEGDMKHITKNDEEIWTMSTYVSVRDHEGNPQKILFLGIDRTKDKKINIDYKGQIEAVDKSAFKAIYHPNGAVLEFNEKMLNLLEYQIEDLDGKTIYDFIEEERHEQFKILWKNILSGRPVEGRHMRRTKTGEIVWLLGTYTAVLDLYGEPAKVVYIATNITDQVIMEVENEKNTKILKNQEKELQKSQVELSQKLRKVRAEIKEQFKEIEVLKVLNDNILDGMLDAVITINKDNYITFFNKAAEDIWKVKQNVVLGQKITFLIPEEVERSEDDMTEYIGKYFGAGNKSLIGRRTEVFLYDKNNKRINVLITLSEAKVDNKYSLTAFIQNIEVELF